MENDGDETGNWRLMRQDTHGTTYFVRGDLSEVFAQKLADDYNAKGHKQFYWAELQEVREPGLK